jgi:hypothetical protein
MLPIALLNVALPIATFIGMVLIYRKLSRIEMFLIGGNGKKSSQVGLRNETHQTKAFDAS